MEHKVKQAAKVKRNASGRFKNRIRICFVTRPIKSRAITLLNGATSSGFQTWSKRSYKESQLKEKSLM